MAAAIIVLTACGGDDGTATTTTQASMTTSTPATTTTTGATTTTATAEPTDPVLEDGVHFGYVTEVVIGDATATATFDLAQLLTGDAAAAAAEEDGAEFLGDFYLRNVNPQLRSLPVDPQAEVIDVDYDQCCDGQPSNIAAFATTVDRPTPVNLTVVGGTVTKVEELYFP